MVQAKKRDKFPGWRFGPNGEAEIFESEDLVPLGWTDSPGAHGETEAVASAADPFNEKRNHLDETYTVNQLLGFLEEMAALDDSIKVDTSMRKAELIDAIIANGGPIDEPKPAEDEPTEQPVPSVAMTRSGEKVAVTDAEVKEFAEAHTNKAMVAALKGMQAGDDSIEFSANWPGMKLARTILENGGTIK